MTPLPLAAQSFSQVIEGQRRLWATTPLLWLMSLWYQANGYTTAECVGFQFMPPKKLLDQATEEQARFPLGVSWAREDLAVPVILIQLQLPDRDKPPHLLVDGIHRVRELHHRNIPEIEVMIVQAPIAQHFEVPQQDAETAFEALCQHQTHPALQAIYDWAKGNVLAEVDRLKVAEEGRRRAALPPLPLPQTLLNRGHHL